MAYAAPKDMVVSYQDVLKTADVKPASFDPHRNVIYKLLARPDISINQEAVRDKVMIFVDLGGTYMDIDLIAEGVSIFKRTLSIAEDLELSKDYGETKSPKFIIIISSGRGSETSVIEKSLSILRILFTLLTTWFTAITRMLRKAPAFPWMFKVLCNSVNPLMNL